MPIPSPSLELTHPFAHNSEPQELLKHSEEQFRTLVANIPGAVYRCTYDGQLQGLSLRTMVFLSEAIETVAGYAASDFINNRVRSFTSIIHPQDRTKIEQGIRQSVIAKQPYVIEYRIVQANGKIVWVYDKGQGISDENGDIQWLDGVILDITERKKAEADLRYTQTFLNSIVENLPVAVFIKDASDLRVMYWNKASEELFGYSREEVLGKNDYDFFPSQQARYLRAKDRQVLAGGELVDIPETPLITPHQGKRIVHTQKVPLFDETGTPQYLLGICRDITEEKLADREATQSAQALRESEAHYRRIVETATEGVWMFDAHSKTTFANSRIAEMLGYTVEDMLGRSLFDFIDEDSRIEAQVYVERRRQGIQERHNFKFRRKDGSVLWALVSATPIFDAEGHFVGVLRMITDISEVYDELRLRKQAEEALRESHQQIADILERITDAFFALDHQWHFTYINGEASRLLHQQPEQLIGANFWDVFPEAVGSLVEQQYRQAMQEQVPVIFETFSAPLNSWLEVRAYPSGSGLSVFWRDITEQKQAQDALRKSEEQYRTLASHFPNGAVLAFDRDLRYTLAEGEALATLGLSKELVEGKTLWEARSPEFCEILEPHYRAALSGMAGTFELEYSNSTYLVHTLPLRNAWGEVFAGMVMKQDITERKRSEEALRQSESQLRAKNQELQQTLRQLKQTQAQLIQNEKMVSLGQMVAGIAHEINNPVSFIYGNIAYAHEYAQNLLNLVKLYGLHYPEPVPAIQEEIEALDLDFVAADFPKLLGSMQEGTNRIREIVLSLRNFSRLDEAQIKPANLHEGLDNTLLLLQHRLKGHAGNSGIEVRKEYGQLPLVECYPGSLNQVFMNLLSNAIDALETQAEPRVITIHTEVETGNMGRAPEEESRRIPQLNSRMLNTPLPPPQFVVIRITDNGSGIPLQVKKQIFDPFFTTKPVGVGTGLGLAIAYSIVVEQHEGNLTCISELGQGAEFVIELPIRQPKLSTATAV
ncbi:PAS domain S-box protein [Allocoleopsis sp.]|uniref:PAS domain-containing sensor histidine kinase n=1 Tax=Allocoleopsis sp. TaxID=3088169 RepID=UPI002FD13595